MKKLFGKLFGNNKRNEQDERFAVGIGETVGVLHPHLSILRGNQSEIENLRKSALDLYLERDPSTPDHETIPSDYVFNLLIMNIGEATQGGAIDPYQSLHLWREFDSFLSKAQHYKTNIVDQGINWWKSILISKGVDAENFKFTI